MAAPDWTDSGLNNFENQTQQLDLIPSVDLCQLPPELPSQCGEHDYSIAISQYSDYYNHTSLTQPDSITAYDWRMSHTDNMVPALDPFNMESDDMIPDFDFGNFDIVGLTNDSDAAPSTCPSNGVATAATYPDTTEAYPSSAESEKSPEEIGLVATSSQLHSSSQSGTFQCNMCPKGFAKKYKLNRHRKWHEKPFKCKVSGCVSRFVYLKDCRRHMNSRHPGFASEEEIFKCSHQTCKYTPKRRDTLKRHQSQVHGINPECRNASSLWGPSATGT